MGQFKLSEVFLDRPGKRPVFVAKQLALDQRLGNGRAVDRHKRSRATLTLLVNGAGNEFLPRPAFTPNQHCGVGVGNLADQIVDLAHFLALPNNVAHVLVTVDLRTEVEDFPH